MDILSLLIIIGIAQGIFTLLLLLSKGKLKNGGLPQLILIILFLIWLLAEFLSVRWPYTIDIDLFYGTRFGSWLLLGPLFLSYVKAATGEKFRSSYLLHFLPFLLFCFIIPLLKDPDLSKFQVDYGMLNVFNPFDIQYTFLQWLYSYVFIFQFLHFTSYLLISVKQINNAQRTFENNSSDGPLFDIYWLRRFCYYLLFTMIIVVIFIVILFYTNVYRRHMDYVYVLPLAFILYFLSFKLSNVSWKKLENEIPKKKYAKSSLTQAQADELLEKLEALMKAEKPYLNNGLRLTDLAESLEVQIHHLSQVINELLDKTFFDYINEKRIEEAKSLIANESHLTLLEIAFKAGFNNKNSFTNAFKKYTGRTPSAFKQEFHLSKN